MIRALLVMSLALIPVTGTAQTTTLPLDEVKKDTTETPAPRVEEKKDAERIEVTGSHIKRIDTEGASPVQTITRKEMDKSGYTSVSDVLRDTGVNSFGSTRESTNSGAPAGNAEISLRGLGSSDTLVLLNGQRLPTDAVTGAVDINLIPMAAVERIEILKDGASAIYGSDALGGVVNIITRKDFSGTQVSFTQTTPTMPGGRKDEISLVNGFNARRLNMVNVVQYRDNAATFSRDRPWSNNQKSEIGTIPSYTDTAGNSRAAPECPPDQIKHTSQGDVCTFKYSDRQSELPDLKQFSLMSESNIEVSSRVKMNVRVGGTQRQTKGTLAPAPGGVQINPATASTIYHGGPLPGVTDPTQPLDFTFRSDALGNRVNEAKTLSYNALVGAKVDMGHDWEYEVNAAHTKVQTTNKGTNGYALDQAVSDIINAGGCNPFDSTAPCNLDAAKYVTSQTMISTMTSMDMKASGELAHLRTGSLALAVGGNVSYQDYKDSYDDETINDHVLGSAGSSGGGGRSTRSGYTELSIPLTEKVEFQVAGRYDHYSDFGDTVNPKLALLYHATKSVLLRGSWGTGFKAPLMQDLYAAKSQGYQSIFDHKACDEERAAGGPTPECAVAQYKSTSGGNKDLKAEKSQSISVGAMYEPTKEFVVSTDLFQIKNRNRVSLDYEDMTVAESKGINPSDYGVTVVRDAAHNNRIISIDAPLQNLASQEVTGIDFGAAYRLGKFKLSTEHSQLFWFKEEGFPGAGLRNKLGERGRPAWRNATALTYNPAFRHELNLIAMTVAGQQKTDPTAGRLSQFTSFDLMYAYQWPKYGTVSLGVKNLLAQAPPVDDTDPTNPVDGTIYDVVGRTVYTGFTASF